MFDEVTGGVDYKDLVVIAAAILGGFAGATVAGGIGFVAGLIVGAGLSAVWARETDVREYERQTDIEAE